MARESMEMKETIDWEGKGLIGVVHLQPLPGSPRYHRSMREICAAAVVDAQAYEEGGAQGLMILRTLSEMRMRKELRKYGHYHEV